MGEVINLPGIVVVGQTPLSQKCKREGGNYDPKTETCQLKGATVTAKPPKQKGGRPVVDVNFSADEVPVITCNETGRVCCVVDGNSADCNVQLEDRTKTINKKL